MRKGVNRLACSWRAKADLPELEGPFRRMIRPGLGHGGGDRWSIL